MAYTPNILVTQKNLTEFTFEDLSFLADIPSAITSMTLQVVNSDAEIDETIDLETVGFSVASQTATISETDLGLDEGTSIPDGVYTLTYTYSFTSVQSPDSSTEELWSFTAEIENYLYNKFASIGDYFFENNPLRTQYVNELVAAKALLVGLKAAASMGYATQYDNILTSLSRLVIFDDYDF